MERLFSLFLFLIRVQPTCRPHSTHPQGRKALFLGDLVDRGDRILDTLKLVHKVTIRLEAISRFAVNPKWLIYLHLRIIYGLEYSLPEHLERLKQRGLGEKRCSALGGSHADKSFVDLKRLHQEAIACP